MSVNNTTLYLYTIKIVYCQGDMFRPLLGHLQGESRFLKEYYVPAEV